MNINVGDVIQFRKNHPCGSDKWEVMRAGADFRLKCTGCGHMVMMKRRDVEKSIKGLIN